MQRRWKITLAVIVVSVLAVAGGIELTSQFFSTPSSPLDVANAPQCTTDSNNTLPCGFAGGSQGVFVLVAANLTASPSKNGSGTLSLNLVHSGKLHRHKPRRCHLATWKHQPHSSHIHHCSWADKNLYGLHSLKFWTRSWSEIQVDDRFHHAEPRAIVTKWHNRRIEPYANRTLNLPPTVGGVARSKPDRPFLQCPKVEPIR
jgi:hypothetical protein